VSKGYLIAILLAVAALVFASPQVIQELWPDLGRPEVLAIYIGCTVITVALVVASIVTAMWEDDPAAKWRRKASGFKKKAIGRSLVAVTIVLGLAWYFLPLDPLANQLPGFTAYAVINLQNQPDSHRKYVFTFGPNGVARAEFYMSAAGEYTFTVTDIWGEKYSLETNVGVDGIPQNKFVALFNQVGLTKKTTVLRISINNREVIRRTIPFVIDLGDTKWPPITLGGGASFQLAEIASYPFSLSNKAISALWANVEAFYKI
jgi:hypothetical protein